MSFIAICMLFQTRGMVGCLTADRLCLQNVLYEYNSILGLAMYLYRDALLRTVTVKGIYIVFCDGMSWSSTGPVLTFCGAITLLLVGTVALLSLLNIASCLQMGVFVAWSSAHKPPRYTRDNSEKNGLRWLWHLLCVCPFCF